MYSLSSLYATRIELFLQTAHLCESLFNPFSFARINQVPRLSLYQFFPSACTNYQFWFCPSLWRVTLRSMLIGVLFHFSLHPAQFLRLLVTTTILFSEFFFKLTPTSANMDSVSALQSHTPLSDFWENSGYTLSFQNCKCCVENLIMITWKW